MINNKLRDQLFKGCGDVLVLNMDDNHFRIIRDNELGNRLNWKKCERILSKNNIKHWCGTDGYDRCIDFYL